MDYEKEYRHTKNTPFHVSVGGAAYQIEEGKIFVTVLGRKKEDGDHFHLPKGTLRVGENLETCALREVVEESGLECEIKTLLGGFTQKYIARDGLNVEKTTLYFAMEIKRNLKVHDNEHDFVEILEIDDAIEKLRRTEPKKQEYEILERLNEWLMRSRNLKSY